MDESIGVYIHIPFCKSKCYYCDFNSYSGREHLAGSYFNALKSEIISRSDMIGNRQVSSIFIGGGTPSLVGPEYIRALMKVCSKHLNTNNCAEISMESNPGTLSYESLRQYREMGINRLSIGLQAWQDSLLKSIGRIHSRQQFIDNLEAAVEAGFDNINVDLIFGLPGQTLEDWVETIEGIAALSNNMSPHSIMHLSCYSLIIEEGTVLGDRLEAGALVPAEDELDRRMYHFAVETLGKKGYKHYEISNFAYTGYECKHNLIYWKAKEYVGFGAGAHSYLDGVRFSNVSGIEEYIEASKTTAGGGNMSNLYVDKHVIDKNESMSEFMLLGFRLTDGISSAEFKERFGESLEETYGDKLHKLVSKGLILSNENCMSRDNVTYKLTRRGLDLANSVFIEFI